MPSAVDPAVFVRFLVICLGQTVSGGESHLALDNVIKRRGLFTVPKSSRRRKCFGCAGRTIGLPVHAQMNRGRQFWCVPFDCAKCLTRLDGAVAERLKAAVC